jgi:hypothetical protein
MTTAVIEEIAGPFNGVTTDFTLLHSYYPGTLYAYLNGQLLSNTPDDGCIEISPNIMSMRVAPEAGDTLHAFYHVERPIGGGFMPPPLMTKLIELVPIMIRATDLRPVMLSAEEM